MIERENPIDKRADSSSFTSASDRLGTHAAAHTRTRALIATLA